LTHNKSADSQMASSQATSSKLIGLAGNKQMQPGVTDSQAIDSHAKCIKLIRQVASSQLTDSKGKQLITSSQTKSDKTKQPGDKQSVDWQQVYTTNGKLADKIRQPNGQQAHRLGGDKHVQKARQATDSKLMAVA